MLGIVDEVHAALQHIGAAQGRKAVEVDADDEVGIVGHEGRQLVIYNLVVELQLVELCELELEVVVLIII